ncbi:hypothetical protein J27TS7_16010 [Paenibacillus dendritiformis]|uniref:hypothetical protein n=1 Tax=Paenibacillus dendritiformis TaxID=130049 RepID=UPI001B1F40F9|nr:hypothetical protein [Paenibacillus dendritiformis]GIO72087.1 hypothetical protein J27TS7_16010 [Paenibacillus dendritiformis]
MTKKNDPLDENSSKQLADIFNDLFGDSDPFPVLKREYKPLPLKKKGDIEYEVRWHTTDLEKDGHKVIHVAQNRFGESVMIYRLMYGDGMDDVNIHIKVKVISKDGVKAPDSNVHVHVENKHMDIADIKIEGERVNRGYGSIMMEGLMKIVHEMQIKVITGWISSVDWDHIDRSEHFYRKHGFDCQLDHENKRGTILWVNNELVNGEIN